MKKNKRIFIVILAFIFIFLPLSIKQNQIFNSEVDISPIAAAAPVIIDIGGGVDDLDLFKENYTGNFPWNLSHYDWALYWYVNYTSDAPIWYFFYNTTYGSLNGYNGSFTPLYDPQGPGMSIDNEMYCFEAGNPDELVNFGWEVKVWIEDSDGLVSAPVTKLFKYYNGTIEEPVEELEFEATAEKSIINPNQTIVVNFTISDPDGPRDYQVNYTCDYENFDSISNSDITTLAAIFTPGASIYTWWDEKVTFTFTFNLTVWESFIMVDSKIDTAVVYVTSPPENGTCTIVTHSLPEGGGLGTYVYNVSCVDWVDDLDGDGPFFYKCISKYELDNPEYYQVMHEGTYESDFQLTVTERYNGYCYLWIYDSHGAYTTVDLGKLGYNPNHPDILETIPGYSIYLLYLAIFSGIIGILWKIKKQSNSN